MNALIRPALVAVVVSVLAACLFGAFFACGQAGLRELLQQDNRHQQLQQFQQTTSRHIEAREQLLLEAIFQRCSLREVFTRLQEVDREWLEELDRDWPDSAIGIRMAYQQASSDADYYYGLITWRAIDLLKDRPEEAAAVLRRLERDYRQLQNGPQTLWKPPKERAEPSP